MFSHNPRIRLPPLSTGEDEVVKTPVLPHPLVPALFLSLKLLNASGKVINYSVMVMMPSTALITVHSFPTYFPGTPYEVDTIIIPNFQVRKLMSNKVMQLAQNSQLMNMGRAQMQSCLALNDYLRLDRLSRLAAVILHTSHRQRCAAGHPTGAPAFEAPCFSCWSLLNDGWRHVSGKESCWNRPAD